jgi:outer membrane protein TolC
VSDLEVAQQATLLEQARAAVPTLDGQRRAALYALAVLTGDPPARYSPAAAACTAPPTLRQPLPVGDGAALLARRPDVRQAERNLAAATARIGVATADLYPTISLAGAANTAAASFNTIGAPGTVGFNVGPVATWTFPNMLVARGEVRGANALAKAALASFDGAILTALKDTETSLTSYAGALEAHAALQKARDHAAEAYRLAGAQYRTGAISFLDLLAAEAASIAADRALAAADQQLATDQIAVFQALGGGWQDAPKIITR